MSSLPRLGVLIAVLVSPIAAAQPATSPAPAEPASAPAPEPADVAPAAAPPDSAAPAEPAPTAPEAPAGADIGLTSSTEPGATNEVIDVQSRWPDADLFTVGHTTRATTMREIPSDSRAGVLGDALEGVPGVSVQRTGPGQGAPIIRGLIGSAVLVVVDGMRLNNAFFRPAPNQYTALVDPHAASRVEVTRGPGSALFGSDAIGGVVNIISPLPRFAGNEWKRQASAITAAATADRSVLGRVSAATGKKGSGVAIGTTVQRHGDVRAGGGEMQGPADYSSIAFDATGHLEHGKDATTVWLQFLEQPSLPRTDELNAGYGEDAPGSAVFRYEPSRRSFAHVRHLLRAPFGSLEGIELHAAWQRIDDDRKNRDTGSTEELTEKNQDDSLGFAARSVAPMFGGELTFGADYWFDRVASTRTSRNIDTQEVSVASGRFADGSTMHQIGSFAEARRTIGPVALRTALRLGLSRIEIAAADRGQGASIDSLNWAGELGGELALGHDLYLVANASRAYRAPNIQDLSGLGPRPGNRYQVPADNLGDEQALGGDLGVRTRRETFDLELFGFALRNDNRIEVVPTGEMTPEGRQIVVSENTGKTNLYGMEAVVRYRPIPTVELEGQTTWAHGEQLTDGMYEPADRLPPANGRGEIRWRVLPRLRLQGAVRGALEQDRLSERDKTDPRINPLGTPGFVTLHAGAQLTLGDFEITLRADNLLDRNYREHGSGTEAPGFDASLLVRWASDAL